MKKQFETKEMLNNWIIDNFSDEDEERDFWDITPSWWDKEDDIIKKLADEGYDLDNLVADGHGYEIGCHTNNGWMYEDEVDLDYIKFNGIEVEIRKRNKEVD